MLLSELKVSAGGQVSRYQLPFGFLGEDQFTSACPSNWPWPAYAERARWLVTDAFSLEPFIRAVIQGLQAGTRLASSDGELRFDATDTWLRCN